MRPDVQRRSLILGAGASALAVGWARGAKALPFLSRAPSPFRPIEDQVRGRLGVAALDTASGRRIVYRAAERFPMCSTFKLLLAAFVLTRVDQGVESLGRRIAYGKDDLLGHSPVTTAHLKEGALTLGELCAAAVTESDNGAANLIFAQIGGPIGLTAWFRRLGDKITRLDRVEMALNTCVPGDPRDTTTPGVMVETLQKVLTGPVLTEASRARLIGWMNTSTTGLKRLRAGLTPDWRAADKTGTGDYGTVNDLAIFWPPKRRPILVAAFITGSIADVSACESALADVGRVVEAAFYG